MTWRELEAKALYSLRNRIIIDVRSPGEFAAEHIPHAINIPLLTNSERAEVGLLYASEGEVAARRLGLKIISPKIPGIVDQISDLKRQESALVIHCWRGGLRSESVASFLSIVGIDCWRLTGGYKAWRRLVLNDFSRADFLPLNNIVVLQGRTGVGKTEVLQCLERRGAQVVNLELMANHRGSFFGGLGFTSQPTQKNFEADLWEQVVPMKDAPLFIEAESRKIGRLSLPDCIMQGIRGGRQVLITDSLENRTSRLLRQYLFADAATESPLNHDLAIEALKHVSLLTDKLGKQKVAVIKELADARAYDTIVMMLLEFYYDPLYDQGMTATSFDLTVTADNSEAAAEKIWQWSMSLELSRREH